MVCSSALSVFTSCSVNVNRKEKDIDQDSGIGNRGQEIEGTPNQLKLRGKRVSRGPSAREGPDVSAVVMSQWHGIRASRFADGT